MTLATSTGLKHRLRNLVTSGGFKARLIRAGLGSAGIQAANRVLALALGIVLARTLGAEGYGVYAYAFAVMSLLMVAAEAGVPTLLMREVAASESRADWGLLRGVLRRAGQFVALASTTISLLGLLVVWWLADSLTAPVLYTTTLMLIVLPLSAGAKTVAHAMRGLHRVVIGQAIDRLLRPLLVLALVGSAFLFWPEWRQPEVAMAAQLLAAMVVLIVGWLILQRLTPAPAIIAEPVYKSRDWLRSALPFTLIGGAGIINNYTDIIMLGWFTASEDVGIYRVAVQGATLVAFSLQVANAVVGPQFARLYAQGDMAKLQHLVTRSSQVIFLASMPAALAFIFAGDVVVSWVFGPEYSTAYLPLAALSIGQLLNVSFGLVGSLLQMTGNQGVTARILWQTAVLNIILNTIMIPLLGMLGAALSSATCLFAWHFLLYREAKKCIHIVSLPLPRSIY
ncbi:flippase [Spiribacter sp. 1M153]|uniref:flippase n=1 Tax=Spiribacter roseus TaxID=1855875 RepID=UPI00349F404A